MWSARPSQNGSFVSPRPPLRGNVTLKSRFDTGCLQWRGTAGTWRNVLQNQCVVGCDGGFLSEARHAQPDQNCAEQQLPKCHNKLLPFNPAEEDQTTRTSTHRLAAPVFFFTCYALARTSQPASAASFSSCRHGGPIVRP